MKISKLFHWLYAILMFLPVLVFVPNAFYYGFNKEAIAQEKTVEVPLYYSTNQVDGLGDLHLGSVYTWNDNFNSSLLGNDYNFFDVKILNGAYINQIGTFALNTNGFLFIRRPDNSYFGINNITFDFLITSIGNNFNSLSSSIIQHISICTYSYLNGQFSSVTTDMSISDSMAYAWKSTWENDLFSWSYASFLTQPFLYITNLFNVPSTNSLLYCLSYWLNISIIWLVFDLIMFIPLLVHRWIDKGVLE